MIAKRKKTPCSCSLLFMSGGVIIDRKSTVRYRVMMQTLKAVSHTVSVAY